jgi:membrane-associated PAP2 superfamily phosphatase
MPCEALRRCLLVLPLSGLLLAWIGRYSGLDLQLGDAMFDPVSRSFPWRENWFAAVFMHVWMKYLFTCMGGAVLIALSANVLFPSSYLSRPMRGKLLVVLAAFITVPLAVGIIKSQSIHHCPWDLLRYGGAAPYLRLFDDLPVNVQPGHCFPAGHASSALWLPAISVFCLPDRPRAALLVFAVALLPGLAMGWVQQMRGAHFLSHTLWSTWIASLLVVILLRIWYSGRLHCKPVQGFL